MSDNYQNSRKLWQVLHQSLHRVPEVIFPTHQPNLMSCSEAGGEPVHTTCELIGTYQWKVLTVLNNSPPVCLCVDVNRQKSQRERNKRNHNISLSTMQKICIAFVIRFLRLFTIILSTETLNLTCLL